MLERNPDSTRSSAGKLASLIRVASKTRWFNEDQLGALNAYLTMIGEVSWDKHTANEYLEIIKGLPVMLRNSTQRRVREDEELVSLSERAVAHLASMSAQPQSLAAARALAMVEALEDDDFDQGA